MESIIKRPVTVNGKTGVIELDASDVNALPDEASGVTAGSYGPRSNVTGSNNATVSIPQITVDDRGRVTKVVERTFTAVNTNTTYSAGTGLSLANGAFSLPNKFSAAQTLGPSGNVTAPNDLTVPYLQVNAQGIVTGVANRTYKTPVASSSTAGLMSAADKVKSDATIQIYRKQITIGNSDKCYINMGISSGRQTFFVWSAWNGAALNGVVSATIGGDVKHTLVNSYHTTSGTGRILVTLSGRKICIDVGAVPCYDWVIVESLQDFTLSAS